MTDTQIQTCLVYDAKDAIHAGDPVVIEEFADIPTVSPAKAHQPVRNLYGVAIRDMYRNVDLMGAYCVDVIRKGKIEVQLPDKPGFDVYIR